MSRQQRSCKPATYGVLSIIFVLILIFKTQLKENYSSLDFNITSEDFATSMDSAIRLLSFNNGFENHNVITGNTSESVNDWESLLKAAPSLVDTKTASSNLKSSVTILNPQPSYLVGESLRLRVDIRDDTGRQIDHGGDGIRVTLDDVHNDAHLATHVDDLKNGSYLAIIPLLWAGRPSVRVNIAVQFAIYRAFYHIRSVLKSTRPQRGVFNNGNDSEVTVCSPFKHIPSYSNKSVCDFTSRNGGLGWYCVKPRGKDLNCDDWSAVLDSGFVRDQPVTTAETNLVFGSDYLKAHGQPGVRFIPNILKLNVKQRPNVSVDVEMYSQPPTDPIIRSWTDKAPRGYFMAEQWRPRHVQARRLNQGELLSLLENTTVYLLGDSNSRIMFKIIARRTGCKINTGVVQPAWHHPLHCVDDASGFKMHWFIHALPFHAGKEGGAADSRAVNLVVDDIPKSGRFVVCIHLYAHLAFHSMDLFK